MRLLEQALGEPLMEYLRRLRNDDRSWEYIATKINKELAAKGVEHVVASDESLRRCFNQPHSSDRRAS